MNNITIEEIEKAIEESYKEYMELIESYEEFNVLIQDLQNLAKREIIEEPL